MRLFVSIALICITMTMTIHAEGVSVFWPSLGKDADAYDLMMEQAAFMDVPRSDLGAMVSGIHESSHSSDSRQSLARSYYWKGWVIVRSNPDSASRLLDRALSICDSVKYPYDHSRFSILKADLLRYGGKYADAYFIYRDKIDRLRKIGDDFWAAKATVGIGAIMQELGEYHEALRNYKSAEDNFKRAGSFACVTKNTLNLANINYLLGFTSKALEYLDGLERNKYVVNDSVYVTNVLVSRFQISDYSDREAALKAFEMSRKINNLPLRTIALMSVAALAHNDGDLRKAIDYLRQALEITEKTGDIPDRKNVLESLSECYAGLEMTDSVDFYRNEILLLTESLYNRDNVAKLKKAEHLATINQYEERIAQENEKHRLRQTLVISLSGFMCVILVLSLCLMWYSKRKTESDRKLEEEKSRHLETLNEQYSLHIESIEKELTGNTMLLARKNAKLKELAAKIKELQCNGNIATTEGKEINDKIYNELSTDDWRFFKLRFDKVHPTFFSSLKERYPSLSKTDLRLCAYIRVGMSAKEIAQILSVRPDTVNTSRYRIRKKMNLNSSDSLESLLESF